MEAQNFKNEGKEFKDEIVVYETGIDTKYHYRGTIMCPAKFFNY